ncbi:hypothetical protein CsSME_00043749 [Camellia sinensis var. sinensis]
MSNLINLQTYPFVHLLNLYILYLGMPMAAYNLGSHDVSPKGILTFLNSIFMVVGSSFCLSLICQSRNIIDPYSRIEEHSPLFWEAKKNVQKLKKRKISGQINEFCHQLLFTS